MPDFLDIRKSGVIIVENREKYMRDLLPKFRSNGSERKGSKVYEDKDGRRIIADIYCFPSGTTFIIGYYQPMENAGDSLGALLDEIEADDDW